MPGAPLLHGYQTSTAPQGEGGAARAQEAVSTFPGVSMGSSTAFIVWLVIIGVVLPVLILGGLKVGRFQFVFRGGR